MVSENRSVSCAVLAVDAVGKRGRDWYHGCACHQSQSHPVSSVAHISVYAMTVGAKHTLIIGRNGSGKTVAGAWHLSQAPFNKKPYIIVDFKRDKLLNSIRAQEVKVTARPPKKPGLYIVHPMPNEDEKTNAFLWRVWENENTGVYVDEGFMLGSGDAFEALLTQGRSKEIPLIVLTQRPVWLSRFCFSESEYLQVFKLQDYRDWQTVQPFVDADLEALFGGREGERLPPYYSIWHDVGDGQSTLLRPVPDPVSIRHKFRERLGRGVRAL